MTRIVRKAENTMQAETPQDAAPNGQTTWAEIGGMTYADAKNIAQVGCDLAGSGRLDEARIVFEGLTAMNPKDAAARAALGTVYQKLGRITDALIEYSAAIDGDPKNPIALTNRGELRLKANDKEGFTDLARAVQADPHGETSAGRRARGLVQAITTKAVHAPSKKR